MFARRDQENVVRAHQTVPTGKPLAGGKPLIHSTNTITPAAPRNRAPLGAKTSNTKQTAFKTPAPLGAGGLPKTQRRSASARKPKLKIQPDVVEPENRNAVVEEEEPEIEYCPPKITPLEYASDDELFPEGVVLPTLNDGRNLEGWRAEFESQVGADGLSRREREARRKDESLDALCDRVILESVESSMHPDDLTPDFAALKQRAVDRDAAVNGLPGARLPRPGPEPTKRQPQKSPESTMSARTAATALSGRPRPNFAAPTVAAKARQAATAEPVKRKAPVPASRTTIGYSRGKKVSSSLRGEGGATSSASTVGPSRSKRPAAAAGLGFDGKEQEELLRELTSRAEAEDEEGSPLFAEDDTFDDWFEQQMGGFRLTLPAGDGGGET